MGLQVDKENVEVAIREIARKMTPFAPLVISENRQTL
jgi:hypothetical protein